MAQRLAAISWNNSQFISCKPESVNEILLKLNDYFGLKFDKDYFSFGNLKIGTIAFCADHGGGPALNGTDSEKKKRDLYLKLISQINLYETFTKIKTLLNDYDIYPLVLFNDSLIFDSDIEIDIDSEKNVRYFSFEDLKKELSEEEIISFVSNGLLTKLFYIRRFSHRIINKCCATSYPRKSSYTFEEVKEIINSCENDFYRLIMKFNVDSSNYESELRIKELLPNEIKLSPRIIIVERGNKFCLEYCVKSPKSNASLIRRVVNFDVK